MIFGREANEILIVHAPLTEKLARGITNNDDERAYLHGIHDRPIGEKTVVVVNPDQMGGVVNGAVVEAEERYTQEWIEKVGLRRVVKLNRDITQVTDEEIAAGNNPLLQGIEGFRFTGTILTPNPAITVIGRRDSSGIVNIAGRALQSFPETPAAYVDRRATLKDGMSDKYGFAIARAGGNTVEELPGWNGRVLKVTRRGVPQDIHTAPTTHL